MLRTRAAVEGAPSVYDMKANSVAGRLVGAEVGKQGHREEWQQEWQAYLPASASSALRCPRDKRHSSNAMRGVVNGR